MRLTGMTKIGAIAAVLTAVLAAAAPASADSYRAYFGDRDGAGMRVVIHDNHRDFRDRHEMQRRDTFPRQARFRHYGWDYQHRDREFRY